MSGSEWLWGTVTSVNPVRVRLDGDTDPLPFTPWSTGDLGGLTIYQRVWCQFIRGKVVVHTAGGGGLARRMWKTSSQPVNSGQLVTVTGWSAGPNDPGNASGITFSDAGFVVPKGGAWLASAQLSFESNGAGGREIILSVNGQQVETRRLSAAVDPLGRVGITAILILNAGDTVTLRVYHSAGATINISPGTFDNFFSIAHLGATGGGSAQQELAQAINAVRQDLTPTSGRNSSGYWVRFPDGTQLCSTMLSVEPVANVWTTVKWVFPQPFVSDVQTVLGLASVSSAVQQCAAQNQTLTGVEVGVLRTNETTTSVRVEALGRWKT